MSNDSLFSDALEKMIDSQVSNTQALTSLNNSIHEINVKSSEIESHFTNGFRSDIKEHVTEEFETVNEVNSEILKSIEHLTREVKSFKSVGFWFKTVGGLIAAIAAIVIAITAAMSKF